VEHPVTEQVTGRDLIALQLRVAGGEGLGLEQSDIRVCGHAIECRINAEDPSNGFLPSPGRITRWEPPRGEGLRLDTHARAGYLVPPFYDSMIGKLIASGPTRDVAAARLVQAAQGFCIEGPRTTLPLAAYIVAHADFLSNDLTTRWLEVRALPAFAPS
ncbi:MAG: acetyl-CoA carboxylase biotin carboxylase subunit, partial [Steroidobacteraceae bacterium]